MNASSASGISGMSRPMLLDSAANRRCRALPEASADTPSTSAGALAAKICLTSAGPSSSRLGGGGGASGEKSRSAKR
eukprot:4869943-Pyramimonas_sp.AAC.1